MADSIWSAKNAAHVQHFAAYLKPFLRSAQTRMFDDAEVARETVQAFILGLDDVPADVLEEARARLLREGLTWMPRPGDVKRHCVEIVGERIKAIAIRARALTEECESCGGSGWRTVEIAGVERVTRCGCHAQSMALMGTAPTALALPPAKDENDAA